MYQMFKSEVLYGDNNGEPNEEVIYSRDPKIVNYSWTKEATRMLIGIRTQLDAEFDDPNQRKMDLWEKISLTLKDHGFDFPPSICDKKWRNLLVSFRRTISRGTQGKLGRFPYTWEFYEDLLAYWQKKDPVGVRKLQLAAQNYNSESFQDDEPLDDNEFDPLQDENFDEEEIDDGGDGGDLNNFLSVTLTESDDETGQEQRDGCIIGRRGEIEIRPHHQIPKVESLEISAVPYSPKNFKTADSPPLQLQVRKYPIDITHVPNNRSVKFRPPPTITIEEVRPTKRKIIEEEDDDNDIPQPSSIQALALNNSQLNISFLDRSDHNDVDFNSGPSLKQRREHEESPPAPWLVHLKSMEENTQRRWEITEARQSREYKQKRELDLQLLQTMQNLSSVLVKMTEES